MVLLMSFWWLFFLLCLLMVMMYFIGDSIWIFSVVLSDFSWSSLKLNMMADEVSVVFSLVVVLVSMSVMLFSTVYMKDEVILNYFVILIILFISGMLILVMSGSFLMSYLGWDILGVVSFLLIIFYGNYSSVGGSLVTMLMNRVGDCLMVMMFIWVLMVDQEWLVVGWVSEGGGLVLSLMIVLAVVTKSAQFPYSIWLPLAMCAPTPVSALVHSSTLVTAGVYVMVRWYKMLSLISWEVLYIMSMLTIIYSGILLVSEEDLKKIVALSTLMHLGIMMGLITLGGWYSCFIHMSLHALYKSLLFISVGFMIINMEHDQSISSFSGLYAFMTFSSGLMLISAMSLSGLPYMSGFYTKEIMMSLIMVSSLSMVWGVLGFISICVSLLYCLRMISVFIGASVNRSVVSIKNSLGSMSCFWMGLFGIMGAMFGGGLVSKVSADLGLVYFMVEELVVYYLVMMFVAYVMWGVKMSFSLNMGFWVDLFVCGLLYIYMKFLKVACLLDVWWSDYVGKQVVVGMSSGAGLVTWFNLINSLMLYIISFMFIVILLMF